MKMRTPWLIVLLILVYVGPYAFVYGRTATWTFPRIDERDFKAIEGVDSSVSSEVSLTNVNTIGGAQEANYSIKAGVLHRKFLDWIGFPLVLEVNNFTFKGTGIYQNKIVFECNHFETAFPKPTGSEPWYIYQPLVDKNDNTYLNISCNGDASAINVENPPGGVNFVWSMSASLVGDRNEEVRSWNGSQPVQVKDLHQL
jgi:hypothetical protein